MSTMNLQTQTTFTNCPERVTTCSDFSSLYTQSQQSNFQFCSSSQILSILNRLNNEYPQEYAKLDTSTNTCDAQSGNIGFCADSDNGDNIYIKGSATVSDGQGNEETGFDTCLSSSTIREYICESGASIAYEDFECPNGFSCSNGKCVQAQECFDEDGSDFENSLTIKSRATQGNQVREDTCLGSTLSEGICQNGQLSVDYVICPDGCSNGACLTNVQCDLSGNIKPCDRITLQELEVLTSQWRSRDITDIEYNEVILLWRST